MMSLGKLCEKRGPAAEVWDKDGNRKIIDLTPWWKSMSYFPEILKGNGDELWLYSDELNPIILHYKDGTIVPVPELRRQIASVFVSARGELFVSDGAAIYHFEGDKWSTAGVLPALVAPCERGDDQPDCDAPTLRYLDELMSLLHPVQCLERVGLSGRPRA